MEVMITIVDYSSSKPAAAATTYSRPLDASPCFGQHNAALVPSMLVSPYSTPEDGSLKRTRGSPDHESSDGREEEDRESVSVRSRTLH